MQMIDVPMGGDGNGNLPMQYFDRNKLAFVPVTSHEGLPVKVMPGAVANASGVAASGGIVVMCGPHMLLGIRVFTLAPAGFFLALFDSAGAPAVGAEPVIMVPIVNGVAELQYGPHGRPFGIGSFAAVMDGLTYTASVYHTIFDAQFLCI